MRAKAFPSIVFALCIATGCAPPEPLGARCSDDADCESALCRRSVCTLPCSSDAECAEMDVGFTQCDVVDAVCAPPCGSERASLGDDVICAAGRATPCAELPESYCDVCPDLCAGQRCTATGCVPFIENGEPCARGTECRSGYCDPGTDLCDVALPSTGRAVGVRCGVDSHCRSQNCSSITGTCRAALGSSCDADDCDYCLVDGMGWSFCTRECDGRACEGDRCIGSVDHDFYYCRPACEDRTCPGVCGYSDPSDIPYCRPGVGAPAWQLLAVRTNLQPCREDSECTEGRCVSAPSCASGSSSCYGRRGFCGVTCSSDAECGDSGACVQLACSDGVCETRCLPRCGADVGLCEQLGDADCVELDAVAGGSVEVCDPRNEHGEICSSPGDCRSGFCTSGRCTG